MASVSAAILRSTRVSVSSEGRPPDPFAEQRTRKYSERCVVLQASRGESVIVITGAVDHSASEGSDFFEGARTSADGVALDALGAALGVLVTEAVPVGVVGGAVEGAVGATIAVTEIAGALAEVGGETSRVGAFSASQATVPTRMAKEITRPMRGESTTIVDRCIDVGAR